MALSGLGGVVAVALLAGATVCATSGCSTIGYYAQSVTGHLNLVGAAKQSGRHRETDLGHRDLEAGERFDEPNPRRRLLGP